VVDRERTDSSTFEGGEGNFSEVGVLSRKELCRRATCSFSVVRLKGAAPTNAYYLQDTLLDSLNLRWQVSGQGTENWIAIAIQGLDKRFVDFK